MDCPSMVFKRIFRPPPLAGGINVGRRICSTHRGTSPYCGSGASRRDTARVPSPGRGKKERGFPADLSAGEASPDGGDLLSRAHAQYHRRRRAEAVLNHVEINTM